MNNIIFDSPNQTNYRARSRREALRIANGAIKAYEESKIDQGLKYDEEVSDVLFDSFDKQLEAAYKSDKYMD